MRLQHVQHSLLMSLPSPKPVQLQPLLLRFHSPEGDLVLGEPVGGDQHLHLSIPDESTDLMLYCLASHHFVSRSTPYLNMLLGIIPSPSSQHPILPRTPVQCLHCSLVPLEMGSLAMFYIPNNCASITRTRSEDSLKIILPLQRANLSLVVVVFLDDILENSEVMHQNRSILRTAHQKVVHKSKSRYPISMIPQCPHQTILLNIIYFHHPIRQPNRQDTILNLEPTDIGIGGCFIEFEQVVRRIQKALIIECYSQWPFLAPIHGIEIEIISILGNIQHFYRTLNIRLQLLRTTRRCL